MNPRALCPNCKSSEDVYVVLGVGNVVRSCLEFIVGLLDFVLVTGPVADTYFPLTCKCRKCGARFKEPREMPRPKKSLGICAHCQYSLTGNVSGICPECGQPLSSEQQRFVQDVAKE